MSTALSTGERSLFLGARIPTYVKTLPAHLPSVGQSTFLSLVDLCVSDLEGKTVTPELYQKIKEFCTDSSHIDIVYAALYVILHSALRIPQGLLKKQVFIEDLIELKIPEKYVKDLADILYGPKRALIDENISKNAPHLPHLDKLKWRVDVTISTSSLSKVLEPTLLMEVNASDGKKLCFEVQPAQFHQLRFAVASLLKEIEVLEKRNIIKMNL